VTHWSIRESSANEVDGFQIAWLPPRAYEYVSPKLKTLRDGKIKIELEAGPYVGTLPLTNGDMLRILPRVGERAFWRMLLFSENVPEAVCREFDQLSEVSHAEMGGASWESLLARSFFIQLLTIEKNSLRSNRVKVSGRLAGARGQVRLLPTIVALKRREPLPVFCTYKERTYATPEHRVLAAAARRLLSLGIVDGGHRAVAIRWARQSVGAFSLRELTEVMSSIRTERYAGARSYYVAALTMAGLVLAQAGISFDEEQNVASEALMTNMRTLFERYIRSIVRNALSDEGFVVEKREDHTHTLFEDGTCALLPDVLISDAKGVRLIVDAKYKIDKPVEEADYYQIAAYLAGYGVSQGILVMPTADEQPRSTISRRTYSGFQIREMRVSLNDWLGTEALVREEVRQLLAVTRG
jgi:5-methylcytosine-specific restriction endonuclease McrBC regulatory subunit McrC